ncbi:(2Fe-2S)-binding protein [Haloechinothrix salitolerans]|uniref:(2Fe-2S)-binding protein n=1 Tax=Haloechinothrix salitolerans TaxID=926830 RepID=A0ABW2BV94_9PSEU
MSYKFTVNEEEVDSDLAGVTPLLSVLREELGLVAAKLGCGEGRCGACTVLLDGRPVAACVVPLASVAGAEVRTAESLAAGDAPLTRVQEALLDEGGVQCGACTPGMLMTLTALAEQGKAEWTEESVRSAIAGNICRCTGYHKIVDAAMRSVPAEGGTR